MITIRELTKKCSVHNTPLSSKPVEGTDGRMNGRPFKRMIGRLYYCPLCDLAAKDINYSR